MANKRWLIDAYALERRIAEMAREPAYQHTGEDWLNGLFMAMEAINEMPTVDAVEVKHGEWEIIGDDCLSLVEMKCSVCGEAFGFEYFEDVTPLNYHYCPNCGANMRGDGNG